jgi:hypothetical protein
MQRSCSGSKLKIELEWTQKLNPMSGLKFRVDRNLSGSGKQGASLFSKTMSKSSGTKFDSTETRFGGKELTSMLQNPPSSGDPRLSKDPSQKLEEQICNYSSSIQKLYTKLGIPRWTAKSRRTGTLSARYRSSRADITATETAGQE